MLTFFSGGNSSSCCWNSQSSFKCCLQFEHKHPGKYPKFSCFSPSAYNIISVFLFLPPQPLNVILKDFYKGPIKLNFHQQLGCWILKHVSVCLEKCNIKKLKYCVLTYLRIRVVLLTLLTWVSPDVSCIIAAPEKRSKAEYWPKPVRLGTVAILGPTEISTCAGLCQMAIWRLKLLYHPHIPNDIKKLMMCQKCPTVEPF